MSRLMASMACGLLALSAAAQKTASYKTTSVTGCLVEQAGPKYVLHDVKGKFTAELEPIAFPVQTFAKYLGKQVRLNGRLSSGKEPEVMRVRAIKGLSGPCAAK